MVLYDRFGRRLLGLRISITSRCNYNCIFCHSEGILKEGGEELSVDEIEVLGRAAYELGIKSIKLTGGEPLLRKDIVDIVERLANIGFEDLAVTTNGYYLGQLAPALAQKGLKRVNINIPSLKEEVYCKITGLNALERVLIGVEKAVKSGLKPVKINVVVLKGVNDNEVSSFIKYAKEKNLVVQLIELEPIGVEKTFFEKYFFSLAEIEKNLSRESIEKTVRLGMHGRRVYTLKNGTRVEFVRWLNNAFFCSHCTRLRVTWKGDVKTCIWRAPVLSLKDALKSGDVEEVKRLLIKALILRTPFYRVDPYED